MKKRYKEIFDKIKPDYELISSVLNAEKEKNFFIKPLAVAACMIVAAVGLFFMTESLNGVIDEKKIVNLIVAHETRKPAESSSHVTRKIYGKEKTINIDADIVVEGSINDMGIYKAVHLQFPSEELEEILLGDNGLYFGDVSKASIMFPTGGGINFGVTVPEVNYYEQIAKSEEYAKGCNLSYLEAKRIADDFLNRHSVKDFIFQKGEIADKSVYGYGYSSTGFYVFRYLQYADGFPLETVTADVDSGVASELSVYVNDEGVIYVRLYGLELSEKADCSDNLISADEAIDLVEENIDGLWLSEYAPIVEIRLEYMLAQLDDGTLEVVPCWHFCIDQTQIHYLSLEEARKNDTNDLCVNAVTGEMFRVADRYPVFKTADGVYSTWGK